MPKFRFRAKPVKPERQEAQRRVALFGGVAVETNLAQQLVSDFKDRLSALYMNSCQSLGGAEMCDDAGGGSTRGLASVEVTLVVSFSRGAENKTRAALDDLVRDLVRPAKL